MAISAGALLLLAIAGAAWLGFTGLPQDAPSARGTEPAARAAPTTSGAACPPVAAPPAPAPTLLYFEGSGPGTTTSFATTQRLLEASIRYVGTSDLRIELQTPDGQTRDVLADEVGPYSAHRYLSVPLGTYSFEVEATGDWNITLHQPRGATGEPTPNGISGSGATSPAPLRLECGSRTFQLEHPGPGTFRVRLLDANGNLVQTLADQQGAFTRSHTITIMAHGAHYLDVEAHGSWVIQVT